MEISKSSREAKLIIEMKEFFTKYNTINGLKINKLFVIAAFIIAGVTASFFPVEKNNVVNEQFEKSVSVFDDDLSFELIINFKERNCSQEAESSVNTGVSKSISSFYNNLKLTVTKILNT
ncbi:MAG: hypothetical protein R6W68_16375 [Ignavibacteriaceae bacterium]